MINRTTLILTGKEVRRLINMPEVLATVERAFALHGKGRVQMPPKMYIHLNKYKGDLRAMPVYVEGIEACGIKWVNVHTKNRRAGLPTVMALFILNDAATGFPLCVMDATAITSFRTGAGGGIAAKYLARKESSVLGLVGSGVQAATQLEALCNIFGIRTVYVWSNKKKEADRFVENNERPGVVMRSTRTVRACVEHADIVVTTTPVRRPVVRSAWIKGGTHINAIGADAKGKEELEPGLLRRSKIVVDDREQAYHSGEINVPMSKGLITRKNVYASLGEVVVGKKKGRTSPKEITIFDSTGLAIQDVAVAQLLYKKALKNRLGKRIRLIS